jgi:hypothetical protein
VHAQTPHHSQRHGPLKLSLVTCTSRLTRNTDALPLRGRGDTAAAAAEEWDSLCRDASPAQNLRTKIWVTMSRGSGREFWTE